MALAHSPKIITDGLAFYYDMGNAEKSWVGRPTTNLLPETTRTHTGGMGPYWSGQISANNTERGFPSFKVTTVNNDRLDGFITSNAGNLSNGVTYTWSADVWVPSGKTIQIRMRNITGGGSLGSSALNINGTNSWVRVSKTFVADTNTSGAIEGNEQDNVTDVYSFWVKNLQLEQQPFATPFVNGTRSNTQAILDLTNNNTITASSLTYNTDGTFSFNGSSNFATFGSAASISSIGGTSSITVEAWVRYNSYVGSGGSRPYSVVTHKGTPWTWLMENPNNRGRIRFTIGGADVNCADPDTHPLNTWMQWVGTYDGANMRFYRDGILKNTVARTGTLGSNSINAEIGQFSNDYRMDGSIGIVKVYNRALSASEVAQNFAALRGRYRV